MREKSNLSNIVIAIIGVISLLIFGFSRSDSKYVESIGSDGKGYYANLPALFIYKSLDFNYLTQKVEVYKEEPNQRFLVDVNGRKVNKYTIGTDILMLPFFIIACILSYIFGFEVDGYNSIFQDSIAFAGIFYMLAGFYFVAKLLNTFKISPEKISILLIVSFLSTNIINYAIFDAAFSHVYSFFAIAAFLYYFRKLFITPTFRIIKIAALLGLIILIRPTNVLIVLLIPFLAEAKGSFGEFFKKLMQKPQRFFLATLSFFGILFIQSIVWKIQSHQFFVNTYPNEGFYWFNPNFKEYLWGFNKGLFVYTPLLALSFLGFLSPKWNGLQKFSLMAFIFGFIYINAAWWDISFGDSLGQRAAIDVLPAFILLLVGISYWPIPTFLQIIIFSFYTIFSLHSAIQTYQYRNNILHKYGMDYEKFKFSILKFSKKYENTITGDESTMMFGKKSEKALLNLFSNFSDSCAICKDNIVAYEDNFLCQLKSNIEFSGKLEIPFESLNQKKLFFEVQFETKELESKAAKGNLIAFSFNDEFGKSVKIDYFNLVEIQGLKPNIWRNKKISFNADLRNKSFKSLSLYFWNINKGEFEIDNFYLKIWEIENY